jgi:hypothetical protein
MNWGSGEQGAGGGGEGSEKWGDGSREKKADH